MWNLTFRIFKALSPITKMVFFFRDTELQIVHLTNSALISSASSSLEPHRLQQETIPLSTGRVNSGLAVVLHCSIGF